jgi:nucleoside-diphosphate-sugar epimerase
MRIVAETEPDALFHLAGVYRRQPRPEEIEPMLIANYVLGVQLLEAIRCAGSKAVVVNVGTQHQYYAGNIERPLDLYAQSKQAFQDALAYYADAEGLRHLTLILFETYGPEDWRAKFPAAIADAMRSNTGLPLPEEDMIIDLVEVSDVAAAFVQAAYLLESDPASVAGRSFAVSSGRRLRLSELVRLFEVIAKKQVALEWGRYKLPKRRIDAPWDGPHLPGWSPAVRLEDGIREFLAVRGLAPRQ